MRRAQGDTARLRLSLSITGSAAGVPVLLSVMSIESNRHSRSGRMSLGKTRSRPAALVDALHRRRVAARTTSVPGSWSVLCLTARQRPSLYPLAPARIAPTTSEKICKNNRCWNCREAYPRRSNTAAAAFSMAVSWPEGWWECEDAGGCLRNGCAGIRLHVYQSRQT